MIKKITFDTYPINLHIFIGEKDEDILKYMQSENITELIDDLSSIVESDEAAFLYQDSGNIAIYFRDLHNIGMVTHEAFHATCYIMRYVGVKFTKSSEEAYAYTLQYIVENIYD